MTTLLKNANLLLFAQANCSKMQVCRLFPLKMSKISSLKCSKTAFLPYLGSGAEEPPILKEEQATNLKFCTKYVADRYKPAILHISFNGLQIGDTGKVVQVTGLCKTLNFVHFNSDKVLNLQSLRWNNHTSGHGCGRCFWLCTAPNLPGPAYLPTHDRCRQANGPTRC